MTNYLGKHSSSLREVEQKSWNDALKHLQSKELVKLNGLGSVNFTVGLAELQSLFQPTRFCGSTLSC